MQIAQNDERRDVWEQLLSLQLPPQKEVLDCVEIICQSGKQRRRVRRRKMHRKKNVRMRYRWN